MKIIIITLFFTSFFALSAQDLVTDRPDQTESAVVVPKGSLQIESGLVNEIVQSSGVKETFFTVPTALFRYGLFDFLELRFQHEYVSRSYKDEKMSETTNGFADIQAGIKIGIIKTKSFELGIVSHFVVPSGTHGFSSEKGASINKLAFSHPVTDDISFGYNIGYDYFGEGNGNIFYSYAAGIGITEKMGAFLEVYGDVVEMEKNYSNFDAGITYLVEDNFQLDFSFGTGINHDMNFISCGLSWRVM